MSSINRPLRKAMHAMSAELLSRYGRSAECTKAQVDLTFQEMKIQEDFRPFAYCAFLEPETLDAVKKAVILNWDHIEDGARLSLVARSALDDDHFYESGAAQCGP